MRVNIQNVHVHVWIPELLQKPKIDEIYYASLLPDTHSNVVGFEVTMKEVTRVHILETTKLGMVEIRCVTTEKARIVNLPIVGLRVGWF
jgi:hypothetical protein